MSNVSAKPRRKPVNYEKLAVVTLVKDNLDGRASISAASLPAPTNGADEYGMRDLKSASHGSLNSLLSRSSHRSEISPSPASPSTPYAGSPHFGGRDSISSSSPLLPPPRKASVVGTRLGFPGKSTVGIERPLSAGIQRIHPLQGPRPLEREGPRPPLPQRTASSSAPSLSEMGNVSRQLSVESDPLKREVQELRERCETLKLEKEEAVLKYRRRAHFGMAKTDSSLSEQFKKLTDEAEARQVEQQDLHTAIEMLIRRTKALESQVQALGCEPVTKTDSTLSEARLEEITSGVWKKFEHLNQKADSTTTQTNSVMADILAKTREIRRHLNLPAPIATDTMKRATSNAALAAEPEKFELPVAQTAETPLRPSPAIPMTPSSKLPTGASAAVNAKTNSIDGGKLPVAHAEPLNASGKGDSLKHPNMPVKKIDESIPILTSTDLTLVDMGSQLDALEDSDAKQRKPPPLPAAASEIEAKPITSAERPAKAGAFSDDLLAIMNDFGF
ncbi:hypothetical protein DFJ77DRAFT_530668 [Powellomyces hirtus]|nr:hypothetical protein DFJ77DRAFT_530668 [Powellomyces hirtus]